MAFIIAVVFYFGFFAWMQHRRSFRGPWELTFTTDGIGHPSIKISEPYLNISEELDFPGEKVVTNNLARVQRFPEAVSNLPFGKMIFQDPTFLPGTVTMNQFDHEIECLPRVLIIDKKEIPWHTGDVVKVPQLAKKELSK